MTTQQKQSTRRRVRRGAAAVVLAAVLGGLAAPAALAAPIAASTATAGGSERSAERSAAARGALLAFTPLDRLSRADVAAQLSSFGMDSSTVRHGIAAYRLTYATVDPQGRPTTATGLLVLPEQGPRRLDLVSDTHGTLATRDDAPSGGAGFNRITPYLHASAGRAVAAPDYLGLGGGPGSHPYMDTRSSVTASVDMLKASRTAAGRLGRTTTRDVYATGFSQGGQVAMALGRELSRPGSGFRLRGLAPIAGPYDLLGSELPGITDGRVSPRSAVFYLSYFLTAQNRLHPLYKDPAEVFRAPYAQAVEGLFDGNHSEEDIVAALPATPQELLTPAWAENIRDPRGALRTALEANDGSCDWKPAAPVRLYAGSADTDVPIANARACADDLARRGVRATLVDQGPDADHFTSAIRSAPQAARWFDSLR
ncbi:MULTISPECIES: lipase family protein [unclassified Streptomyces]|uniref:alpha/beta hydrolase family protein n=1 Tax=unclassified Streptomyces TaxID=2593676 RepID=UPI000DC7573D|nr:MULTISPECIES: lipase family protein [unclassified Streptomyces]AWZ05747.1 alpha/beta hydrolase [Streptomyces sp. ICC4]AWZ14415.1 alpha/beta hydrolase [Streptomyces sp. ICC1]